MRLMEINGGRTRATTTTTTPIKNVIIKRIKQITIVARFSLRRHHHQHNRIFVMQNRSFISAVASFPSPPLPPAVDSIIKVRLSSARVFFFVGACSVKTSICCSRASKDTKEVAAAAERRRRGGGGGGGEEASYMYVHATTFIARSFARSTDG